MINNVLTEKKLRKVEECLREFKSIRIENYAEFAATTVLKRFVERNLELAIEQMVDICKHFASGFDLKEPETYRSVLIC